MLCQNHPFFISLIPSRLSECPFPMSAQEGLQPQREGWDFIEVLQSLPLQVNPNFNRKTTQTPGDVCAHSSPATASRQQIFVPLMLLEAQICPRNAPHVNFSYIF